MGRLQERHHYGQRGQRRLYLFRCREPARATVIHAVSEGALELLIF